MIYLLSTKFSLRLDAERKVVEHASPIQPEDPLTPETIEKMLSDDSDLLLVDPDDTQKKQKPE